MFCSLFTFRSVSKSSLDWCTAKRYVGCPQKLCVRPLRKYSRRWMGIFRGVFVTFRQQNKPTKRPITVRVPNCNYATTPSHPAFEKLDQVDGVVEYCLKSNGLQVLIKKDSAAPVASVMVTYRVGSRNESAGETGSTHLLEHLMFKGSKNYNKENGKPMNTLLENVGAVVNASTWLDRTCYYELLPKEYVEEALKMEADRMQYAMLQQSDLEKEMIVVRNEYENDENDNMVTLDRDIWATAFQAHPYHHPTIGWRWDIEHTNANLLKKFYHRFYYPNNASLIVVGDVDISLLLNWIASYFGSIAASKHAIPQVVTKEPIQKGPRRVFVRRRGNEAILGMAFKSPSGSHKDALRLTLLANILANARNTRLYQKLVDPGLATSVTCWQSTFRDPGLFFVYVFMGIDSSLERIEQLVLEELNLVKENGITEEELERAKTSIQTSLLYHRDGTLGFAEALNEALAMGDWNFFGHLSNQMKQVSKQDIQRVAKDYLIENHCTFGWFEPQEAATNEMFEKMNEVITVGGAGRPLSHSGSEDWNAMKEKPNLILLPRSREDSKKTYIAPQVNYSQPCEGVELYTMNTSLAQVVRLQGSLVGGDEHSKRGTWKNLVLADVMVEMFGLRTKNRKKYEISTLLQNVGAGLAFHVNATRLCFEGVCLTENLSLFLSLLSEQLRFPIFLEQDLEIVRSRVRDEIEASKDNTGRITEELFFSELYPRGHPNHAYAVDDYLRSLNEITVNDLIDFHQKYGRGSFRLVAVGDVPVEQLHQDVVKHFGEWKSHEFLSYKMNEYKANNIPVEGIRRFAYLPEKESMDVMIGQPLGISEDHSDYHSLLIAFNILGGNSSSRLMQRIREEQGLTYGIYSGIGGTAYGCDGYWNIHATFSPPLVQLGLDAIQRELDIYVQNGVNGVELEAKKATVRGNFQVGLATSKNIAAAIRRSLDHGRTIHWIDEFPQRIQEVSLEQVNETIQKYIRTNQLVITGCGSKRMDK
eukprot:jgi/Galph1/361/GphlegSOOS_G5115.1